MYRLFISPSAFARCQIQITSPDDLHVRPGYVRSTYRRFVRFLPQERFAGAASRREIPVTQRSLSRTVVRAPRSRSASPGIGPTNFAG